MAKPWPCPFPLICTVCLLLWLVPTQNFIIVLEDFSETNRALHDQWKEIGFN